VVQRLPETTHLIYTELLQALLHAAHPRRGISFHKKVVKGQSHWYLEYVIGSHKKAYYLGPDAPALRAQLEAARARWHEDAEDAGTRARLVAMLVSGGATTLSAAHGRVLESLAQAGVFLVGGVLVGSHAFSLFANMLGVRWSRAAMRTQDVDIAADPMAVTVPDVPVSLEAALRGADARFFPVPSLNRKHPATSYKIRGKEVSVSLLTPMRGKEDTAPRYIAALRAMAEPLRFLDYLLADVQPVAVPVRQGVLVSVPAPARFALHKLVVARRRPVAFAEKARKDVAQAEAVLEVLAEDRPGDVLVAMDAARAMPAQFLRQLQQGLCLLRPDLRRAIGGGG
jgi:hypothetical protein